MNRLLSVSLIALTLAAGTSPKMVAQSPALQKGVHVELASTSNAAPMPDADYAGAWIMTITDNGTEHLGTEPITPTALPDEMKNRFRDPQKKLYIKADARTPYANVENVIEAARSAGVAALTLLTAQQESPAPGTIVSPKGLGVLLDAPSGSGSIMVQVLSSGRQAPILKINHQTVSSEGLRNTLTQAFQNRSDKVILLNADGQLSFAQVVRIIDTCRATGATVVLVTPEL